MMAEGLRPPGPFSVGDAGTDTCPSQRWERWLEQYNFYMKATEKDKKSKAVQVATLLTLLGEQGMDIFRSFEFENNEEKDDIVKVKKKFTDYYTPRQNVIYERYKFLKRRQEPGETFDCFHTAIMKLASTCAYDAAEKNNILRDQIVIGISSDSVRQDLLYEQDLTLERAVAVCRNKEATSQYAENMGHAVGANVSKNFKQSSEVTVHAVQKQGKNKPPFVKNKAQPKKTKECQNCGREHAPKNCPAYGKQCNACRKFNHFARCCRSKKTGQVSRTDSVITTDGNPLVEAGLFAFEVTEARSEELYVTAQLNGTEVSLKVDTGASCNTLPVKIYKQLSNAPLTKLSRKFTTYMGQEIPVLGKCTLQVEYQSKYYVQEYVVINKNVRPLLGLHGCREFGLVNEEGIVGTINVNNDIVKDYNEVFQGIGKLPGEHTIKLKPDAVPAVYAARRVPFRIRDRFKAHLNDMLEKELIVKVTEPTDWVNPIVTVRKKDKTLRVCLDPGPLNAAVKREHYSLPTTEDIFGRLHGSRYFTTLDATSGFMQMALDLESSYLTTFATPFGRYRFTRLPYGLSSAPEVYHRAMFDHFSEIEGVEIFIDDILVHAPDENRHDEILRQVLDRCREINLTLNLAKCKFKSSEVYYLGHVISAEGLKADPKKVEAIMNMAQPKNKDDVQRLLGMLTYLGKFCPKLTDLTEPLRSLIRKGSAWCWDAQHELCLKKIRETVLEQPVLKLYDPSEDIIISVDASQKGLGATIIQGGRPVEYASSTLTETQQRYAQIEKEMLAIQFGLTRFHQYVYGQSVVVETDHKPLLSIVKQPIAGLSPRLQRMRMRCEPYDYSLVYKPGKELIIADFLSRAQLPDEYDVTDALDEEAICMVSSYVIPNDMSKQRIINCTRTDKTLQLLKETIISGWPDQKRQCPEALKPFWCHRNDVTEFEGVLFKGEQVIIPTALRAEAIRNIHDGHLGIVKCTQRAKVSVYWPGYLQQVQDAVETCHKCQEHRDANPPIVLQQHEVPDYPYQVLASDLFELDGHSYLLTVDYLSKWPNVVKIQDTKTATIIEHLQQQFCDFGVPEKLITDNGPQYGSSEFREFMKKLCVNHVTSSPYYAQSNGMAERTVKTVKSSMKKMLSEGRNLLQVLATIRSTPIGANLPSPAMLLQGRNLRCGLHQFPEMLKPRGVNMEKVRQILQARQASTAHYHDINRPVQRHFFKPGDMVRTRQGTHWVPAKIKQHADTPQSYWLELQTGSVVRRNIKDINFTRECLQWPPHVNRSVTNASTRPVCRPRPEPVSSTSAPSVSTSSVPSASMPHNVPINNPVSNDVPTVTRSGRVVKTPPRYQD